MSAEPLEYRRRNVDLANLESRLEAWRSLAEEAAHEIRQRCPACATGHAHPRMAGGSEVCELDSLEQDVLARIDAARRHDAQEREEQG